jgi:hypothetical protein
MKSKKVEEFWRTQDGEMIAVTEMTTIHIFYSLRMLFNHSVPEEQRIPGGKRYKPENWTYEERIIWIKIFLKELALRNSQRGSLNLSPQDQKYVDVIEVFSRTNLI